ncbi:apolipoprotein N-acyltransferase [Donghicola sp. XS_ASV15]|uniref:apolipoprotein N-acyltransferase n=1 Tax=Donghicola sp. XS_ASV15 TaxID=3241295 RepID=UPI003514D328
MTQRLRRLMIGWGAPLVSGAVAAMGQAPFDFLPALIAGFVAAFWWWSRCASPKQAAKFGWLFGTGYFAVTLSWIVEPFLIEPEVFGWMAPFALIFMAGGLALFWALAGYVARQLGGHPVAYAGMLALVELLRAYVLTGFPWALASQGLVDWGAYQAAAWIGPHGVNLVFLTVCASVPLVARRRWVAVPVAAALGGGTFWPIPVQDISENAPIVRMIQPNAVQSQKWTDDNIRKFFDRQVAFTAAPAEAPPDFVVWPETSVPFLLEYAGPALGHVAQQAGGADIVLGIQRRGEANDWYNSAALVLPDGEISEIYDKYHLVPFGEYLPFQKFFDRFGLTGLAAMGVGGYSAGDGPHLVDVPQIGQVLPLICYEAIFPQNVFSAPERPALLVHLTNDAWFGNFSGPYQHLAIARMRAIESGIPVVRAANTGISAVIDSYGNVTGLLGLNTAGYLDRPLPPVRKATIYSHIGDWCALLLILGVVATAFQFRGPFSVDAEEGQA